MSTEHANPSTSLGAGEHDLEYGPTPPGAKHEHTDIDPSVGYKFALWLTVAMVLSVGIVYGTFWFFDGQQNARQRRGAALPAGRRRDAPEPPTPSLQTQPFKDIYLLREDEAKKLTVLRLGRQGRRHRAHPDRRRDGSDAAARVSRRAPDGGDALNVVTQDSSSGRTVAPR